MTKLLFIFYLISNNYLCTSPHKYMRNNGDVVFQIDFQDFFIKDFVEFKLNDCSIFRDTLTSNKSDGLTDMRIYCRLKNEKNYLIQYKNKSIECQTIKDGLILEIFLNGSPNKFKIDLINGQYIGFNKKNENELYVIQSKKPFVYD